MSDIYFINDLIAYVPYILIDFILSRLSFSVI